MGKFDQRKFQRIYENIATGIALTSPDCRFVKRNAAYFALTGYFQDEAAQDSPLFVDLPAGSRRVQAADRRAARGARIAIRDQKPISGQERGDRLVLNFVSTVPDAKGRPARILALVTNITSLMRVQQRLQATDAKLRLIIDKAPGLVAMFDRDIRYAA